MIQKLKPIAVGTAVTVVIAVLFVVFQKGDVVVKLENFASDFFFKVREPPPGSDKVAIIAIDDESLKQIGSWPWQRKEHAKIAQALRYVGARVTVFDIRFDAPEKSTQQKAMEVSSSDESEVRSARVQRVYDTGSPIICSPVITEKFIYFASGDGVVHCYDLKKGTVTLKNEVLKSMIANNQDAKITSIAISEDGMLMAGYTDFSGKPPVKNYKMIFVDIRKEKKLWEFPVESAISSSAIFSGTHVYFGSDSGIFYSVDSKTGKEAWRFHAGGAIKSNPKLIYGSVVFGSDDQNLYCLEAANGEKRWEVKTAGPVRCSPVSYQGKIYCGSNDKFLYEIDENTGNVTRKWDAGIPVVFPPCFYKDRLIFNMVSHGPVAEEHSIQCLDLKTGEEKWRRILGHPVSCPPVASEGYVISGDTGKILTAIEIGTGNVLWTYEPGMKVENAPVIKNNFVYLGMPDDRVHCLYLYPPPVMFPGENDTILSEFVGGNPTVLSYEFDLEAGKTDAAANTDFKNAVSAYAERIRKAFNDRQEFLFEDSVVAEVAPNLAKSRGENIKFTALKKVITEEILVKTPAHSHLQNLLEMAKVLNPADNRTVRKLLERACLSALAEMYFTKAGVSIGGSEQLKCSQQVVTAPYYLYAAAATQRLFSLGHVNIIADKDGIIRVVRLFYEKDGLCYPHQGLASWSLFEYLNGRHNKFRIDGRYVVVEREGGDELRIPYEVDKDGRDIIVRINWADWTNNPREHTAFSKVRIGLLYELWNMRYRNLAPAMFKINRRNPLSKMFLDEKGDVRADIPHEKIDESQLDKALADAYEVACKNADDPVMANFKETYEKHAALKKELESRLSGKICFVGFMGSGGEDNYATPVDPIIKGVFVGANLCDMLAARRFLRLVDTPFLCFVTILISGVSVSLIASLVRPVKALAGTTSLACVSVLFSYFQFQNGILLPTTIPLIAQFFSLLSVVTYRELTEFRKRRIEEEKRKILQEEFSKNTSPELVQEIINHPEAIKKHQPYECTIMFSDIKGFTSISERMSADELGQFMNQYHDVITSEILKHKAFIDKYIGDAVMALYGCPIRYEDHAVRACTAALEVKKVLEVFNKGMAEKNKPKCFTRIGINTGRVIGGMYGSSAKQNFTVIGDAVNVASRLEGLNKYYHTQILVGPLTRKQAGDKFVFRHIDIVRVAGKAEPVEIFELVGHPNEVDDKRKKLFSIYEEAHILYCQGYFDMAIEVIESAQDIKDLVEADKFCSSLLEKCRKYREKVPENFQGITDYTTK